MNDNWSLSKMSCGYICLDAIEDEYDTRLKEVKKVLEILYSERLKYDKPDMLALMCDDYFQYIYIDNKKFVLRIDLGIISINPYEKEGEKYILEIAKEFKI